MIRNLKIGVTRICILFLFYSSNAFSAQTASVIVDKAAVHQYPQASSKVITTLSQNDSVAVSNLPTEGFYKVRLSGGDTGWISGNDILAAGGAMPTNEPQNKSRSRKRSPKDRLKLPPNPDEVTEPEKDKDDEIDQTRILVSGGIQSLNYAGIAQNYEKTPALNFGKNFGIELQRSMNSLFFWAFRAEMFSANSGDQLISSGATQVMKQYSIPIQIGLMFSPINGHKVRFGIGVYGGASVVAYTDITQTTTTATGNIRYQTVELVGTLATQLAFKLGARFGLFFEGDYHYEHTGAVPATTQLGVIPSFLIDYSGVVGKFGLEFCF